MDQVTIELEKRDVTGKAVKRLRQEGLIPAVIHDHGKDSIVVMGQYLDLVKAYQKAGKHNPVNLKAGGKSYMAIIKKADFDPKKNLLRHVVFNAIKANQKVETEVPVRIKLSEDNDATPAERAGFVVLHQLETVQIEALPKDLPEFLTFDGEKLVEVGDHATVADLTVPDGVIVKTEADHPLATVFEPSALQAANDAVGGTDEEADKAEGAEAESTEEAATEASDQKPAESSEK